MAEGIINKEIVVTQKTFTVTTDEYAHFSLSSADCDYKTIIAIDIDPSTADNYKYTVFQMTPNQFRVYYMFDGKTSWEWVLNTTIKVKVSLI